MMIYMVLVLWCHADLKIAIPTSVVLMAFTSLVGVGTKLLLGDLQAGTFENWLAAAPVVADRRPVRRDGGQPDRAPADPVLSFRCCASSSSPGPWCHERGSLSWPGASPRPCWAWCCSCSIFQDMYRHGYRLARRSRLARS